MKKIKSLYATFYYDPHKLRLLLLVNLTVLISLIIFGQTIFYPFIPAGLLVILLWFIATLASAHVYFFPQKLAVVTDDGIKIDRAVLLKWKNVSEAREICVGLGKRRIIVLKTLPGLDCRLTFMQKICCCSKFTAFSIPLYAMTESDAQQIKDLIAGYVPFSDSQS